MEGHLEMSAKERQRLVVLESVIRAELSLTDASAQLGISYRQAQRSLGALKSGGHAGLVHKSRGRPSSHRKPGEFRQAVLARYTQGYPDFGPTLASEKLLERDGLLVHPETLRLWLIDAGLWHPRSPKRRHRTWRKRKACFGELVQMDGSTHAWFEDRGDRCFLMSMVDDATGTTELLFSEEETTRSAMDLLEAWIGRYGVPKALYVDRKSVYVTDREQTIEEQLSATPALTQFGKACHKLGIRIVEAHSPQAKGRVERKHGVCQDRLVKELRLAGVNDIAGGSALLGAWTASINEKYAVPAASEVDMHRALPRGCNLRAIFCLEEQRTLGKDWTVQYLNRWFQIPRQTKLPPSGAKLTVQLWHDGSVHILHKGNCLKSCELAQRPQKPVDVKSMSQAKTQVPPAADHPWRSAKPVYGDTRPFPRALEELAETYLRAPNLGRL
jgi:hypothetical protein